ncbi:hypothetical protein H4582DRAFT_1598616 [Lactarius indigo]|nr:hypothetical protein H4582DRAFT_1598616 [Lactarius indigo]
MPSSHLKFPCLRLSSWLGCLRGPIRITLALVSTLFALSSCNSAPHLHLPHSTVQSPSTSVHCQECGCDPSLVRVSFS